jgi:hypothetical protein
MSEAAGIDLDLRNDFDDKVPRVRDIDVGRQLGLGQPRDIRRTIDGHLRILNACGIVARRAQNHGGGRGRPATEYWLNKEQALIVASKSETEVGEQTLLMLVKAFSVFEQMVLERIPPLLRAECGPWSKTWHTELMNELCALKGEVFTGRHPRWCARMNSIIYECLLGREMYAQLKTQNPSPSKGHNHHQLITDAYRAAFEKQLGIVTALAATAASLEDLEGRLRLLYQKKPLQLPLWAARRPPAPGLAKATPKPQLELVKPSPDDQALA